jgi:CheY-like chemotaxis protein
MLRDMTCRVTDCYIPPIPPLILLVDDLLEIRDIVRHLLEERGLRVLTSSDGASALRAIHAHRPDALVLDLAMPGMDGYQVMRQLKADPETRGIPIIVLSGRQEQERALQHGADAYMEKPCHPDLLLAQVLQLLHERR